MNDEPTQDEGQAEDDWAAAMAEQEQQEQQEQEQDQAQQDTAQADVDALVNNSPLEELAGASSDTTVDGVKPNLDVVLDIPVTITMEVGRTDISIRNLLQLNQGSVVELDRLAGEPLDVMINGTIVAHGEVVVVNDKYGIRMTDVVSPADRIKRIN